MVGVGIQKISYNEQACSIPLREITIMPILLGLDEVQDEASQDIVAEVGAGILLCLCP